MAILVPLGVDQTTGQARTLKSGDTLESSGISFNFLNIGSATTAVATGDLSAGDGTRELAYDASDGFLSLSGVATAGFIISATSNVNGLSRVRCQNTNAGASAEARWDVQADTSGTTLAHGSSGRSVSGAFGPATGTLHCGDDATGGINISCGTALARQFGIFQGGTLSWQITTDRHLIAGSDNVYDVGALGDTRPRNLYVGTDVIVDGAALPRVLSRTASIDLTATGDTAIYTVPTGQSAIITRVVVQPTAATGAAGDASISVGTNASTYDDIVASTTLTGLDATTESFAIDTAGNTHLAVSTEVIRFQIDSADSTATTLTATVHLIGFLF